MQGGGKEPGQARPVAQSGIIVMLNVSFQIKCFWFGLQLQRSLLRLTPWSHDIGGLFFGSLFLLNNPTVYNGGLFKYHKMILIPHKPLN